MYLFQVTREECLPNMVCIDCYNELNKYYTFRKKCEATYQKLKSHVLAVKEKQYKQKILMDVEKKKKLEAENKEQLKFVVTFDKEQYDEVHEVLNLNGVAQVNNFVDVCTLYMFMFNSILYSLTIVLFFNFRNYPN